MTPNAAAASPTAAAAAAGAIVAGMAAGAALDAVRSPHADPEGARALRSAELLFAPATYDAAAGEVDVVWSTGADVLRLDWFTGERFIERLDLAGADLALLQAGAPMLVDHHKAVEGVVGSVSPGSARIEGGRRGVARVRFDRGSAEGRAAEAKVSGGHVRAVSVGYRVQTWEETAPTASSLAVFTARAWQPYEISLVAVPADTGAGTRAAPPPPPAAAAVRNPPPSRGGTMEQHTENPVPTAPAAPTQTPMAPNPAPRPQQQPQSPAPQQSPNEAPPSPGAVPRSPANDDAVRSQAAADERARIVAIQTRVRDLGLETALADAMIADGTRGDAIAVRLVDAIAAGAGNRRAPAGPTPGASVGPSNDDPARILDAMSDAVAAGISPRFQAGERAAEFRGMGPREMAGALLRMRGERSVPRNPNLLAERTFHSTSDFPLLMSNAANKVLLADYATAEPTYRRVMARRSFKDFRPHAFMRAGDFPTLLQVGETGEIKFGTMGEGREQLALATYGRRIRITRQVIVNDDLGVFSDWARPIGRRVGDFENATAMGVVALAGGDGPTLADTLPVFSSDARRKNKAAAPSAISIASLGAGRAAMRGQASLDGLLLNLRPAILLVGAAKELEAEQMTSAISAALAGSVNPFSGRLTVEADANVPGNRWYLFADPADAPVYVYGYLAGAEGPQVTTGGVQGIDGFEVQVILDFVAGAVDFRGAYSNAGA